MRTNHRISRLTIAATSGLLVPGLLLSTAMPVGAAHTESVFPSITASSKASTYTVESGDTLYTIARELNVPLADLLAANDLDLDSLILPGATLVVPRASSGAAKPAPAAAGSTASSKPKAAPAAPSKQLTYTVQSNDGLYTIAYRHGVSLTSLLETNDLTLEDVVHPGTVLTIPAGGRPVAPITATPSSGSGVAAPAAPAAKAATPAASSGTYTVQSNDGLYVIAYRHGVSLTSLLETNDLTLEDVVHPGTVLTIPAGGKPPQPQAASVAATPTTPAIVASTPTTSISVAVAGGQTGAGAAAASKIETVISFARAQLGKPYKFAAAGPEAFDCSGLTTAAYRQIGVYLPQQSLMQSARGSAVDWRSEAIRPGDLVFVNRSGTDFIGHVGIAISSTMWIHAPREGDVVRLGIIPRADKIQAVRRYVTP